MKFSDPTGLQEKENDGSYDYQESDDYVKQCNDAQFNEVKRIWKKMGYDYDLSSLDQKTVGKRLGLNQTKTCLVTCWMMSYVLEGATVDQTFNIMQGEVESGRITKDTSYMKDQITTSENLSKSLKGDKYDDLFLQSPWKGGSQVTYSGVDDFAKSDYKYAFAKYKSTQSDEFHYTLLVNKNGSVRELDPFPNGIQSLKAWNKKSMSLVSIEPKGWYKR